MRRFFALFAAMALPLAAQAIEFNQVQADKLNAQAAALAARIAEVLNSEPGPVLIEEIGRAHV